MATTDKRTFGTRFLDGITQGGLALAQGLTAAGGNEVPYYTNYLESEARRAALEREAQQAYTQMALEKQKIKQTRYENKSQAGLRASQQKQYESSAAMQNALAGVYKRMGGGDGSLPGQPGQMSVVGQNPDGTPIYGPAPSSDWVTTGISGKYPRMASLQGLAQVENVKNAYSDTNTENIKRLDMLSGNINEITQFLTDAPTGRIEGTIEKIKGAVTGGNVNTEGEMYRNNKPSIAVAYYRTTSGDDRTSDSDAKARALPLFPDQGEDPKLIEIKTAFLKRTIKRARDIRSSGRIGDLNFNSVEKEFNQELNKAGYFKPGDTKVIGDTTYVRGKDGKWAQQTKA